MPLKKDKTDANKYNFLKAFEKSLGNITIACNSLKMSRNTVYEWLKKDEEFKKEFEQQEESRLDFVESKMFERIKGYTHKETKVFVYKGSIITKEVTKHYPPDSGLIAFYLETQGQKRGYIRKQIHVNENADPFEGLTIEEIDEKIRQMEEEELRELERENAFKKIPKEEENSNE